MNTTKTSAIIIHSLILISILAIGFTIFAQISAFASLSTSVFYHWFGLEATHLITVDVYLFTSIVISAYYFVQCKNNTAISRVALNALIYLSTTIALIGALAIISAMTILLASLFIGVSKSFFMFFAIITALVVLAIVVLFVIALATSIVAIKKSKSGDESWLYPTLSDLLG